MKRNGRRVKDALLFDWMWNIINGDFYSSQNGEEKKELNKSIKSEVADHDQ